MKKMRLWLISLGGSEVYDFAEMAYLSLGAFFI